MSSRQVASAVRARRQPSSTTRSPNPAETSARTTNIACIGHPSSALSFRSWANGTIASEPPTTSAPNRMGARQSCAIDHDHKKKNQMAAGADVSRYIRAGLSPGIIATTTSAMAQTIRLTDARLARNAAISTRRSMSSTRISTLSSPMPVPSLVAMSPLFGSFITQARRFALAGIAPLRYQYLGDEVERRTAGENWRICVVVGHGSVRVRNSRKADSNSKILCSATNRRDGPGAAVAPRSIREVRSRPPILHCKG